MTGPAAPPPGGSDDATKAARQLEAFFLRRLLAEARPQGGSAIDGGFAGDTFKQMLDEAVADKMADAGGLGLADMLRAQLQPGGAPGESPRAALATSGVGRAAAPSALAMPHAGLPAAPVALPLPRAELPAPGAGYMLPVHGRQTSAYGLRAHPLTQATAMHNGLDLAAPTGTPVVAAAGGTVVHAGPAGTYGNLVTIRHADGMETRYAHLSAVTVERGAHVGQGDEIGKVGSTGASTGPHLHFELRQDGTPRDPSSILPLKKSGERTNR